MIVFFHNRNFVAIAAIDCKEPVHSLISIIPTLQ